MASVKKKFDIKCGDIVDYSGCAPVRNFLIRNYPLGARNTMENY